jgi:hypothetical protein
MQWCIQDGFCQDHLPKDGHSLNTSRCSKADSTAIENGSDEYVWLFGSRQATTLEDQWNVHMASTKRHIAIFRIRLPEVSILILKLL